ncbi:MAG: hypothetical protein ABSE70_05660 [Candidatus Limnocylindrales bacterium]
MTSARIDPKDVGKALRKLALTTAPEELAFSPDKEYPTIYGVVTDWRIGQETASILAMKDGAASLYTTATFGIIGGEGHEKVMAAAQRCVRVGHRFVARSVKTSEFPYPEDDQVNFFLLSYEGVRLCKADETAIRQGSDAIRELFDAAQDLLTELRLVYEEGTEKEAQPEAPANGASPRR